MKLIGWAKIYPYLLISGVIFFTSILCPPITVIFTDDTFTGLEFRYILGLSFGIAFSAFLFGGNWTFLLVGLVSLAVGFVKDVSILPNIAVTLGLIVTLKISTFLFHRLRSRNASKFARKFIGTTTSLVTASLLHGLLLHFSRFLSNQPGMMVDSSAWVSISIANFLGCLIVFPIFEFFLVDHRRREVFYYARSDFATIFMFLVLSIFLIGIGAHAPSLLVLMPIIFGLYLVVARSEGLFLASFYMFFLFVMTLMFILYQGNSLSASQTNELFVLFIFISTFQLLVVDVRVEEVLQKIQSVVFVVALLMSAWGLWYRDLALNNDLSSAQLQIDKVKKQIRGDLYVSLEIFRGMDEILETANGNFKKAKSSWITYLENSNISIRLPYTSALGTVVRSQSPGMKDLNFDFPFSKARLINRVYLPVVLMFPSSGLQTYLDVEMSKNENISMAFENLESGQFTFVNGHSESILVYRSTYTADRWHFMILKNSTFLNDRLFASDRAFYLDVGQGQEPIPMNQFLMASRSPAGIESPVEWGNQNWRVWGSVDGFQSPRYQSQFIFLSLSLLVVLSILGIGFVTFEWFVERDELLVRVQKERSEFEGAASEQRLISQSLREMAGGAVHDVNGRLAILRGRASIIKRQIERKQITLDNVPSQIDSISDAIEGINRVMQSVRSLISQSSKTEELKVFSVKELLENLQTLTFVRLKNHGIDLKLEVVFRESMQDVKLSGRISDLTKLFIHVYSGIHDLVNDKPHPWIKTEIFTFPKQVQFKIVVSRWIDEIGNRSESDVIKIFEKSPNIVSATGIAKSHEGTLDVSSESHHLKIVIVLPRAWS